jgi:hypothetical protein
MAVLTFSQMLQFGSLGLSLGINLANAINVLMNVAYNNLGPFYNGQVRFNKFLAHGNFWY